MTPPARLSMLLTVTGCGDRHVRGVAGDTEAEVTVLLDSGDADTSHLYLLPMLSPGDRLSLVDARLQDGGYVADLVVYRPDYPVNITEIASCFQSYGTNPDIHIINRLRSDPVTEAILLGNFAGQLLDEAVTCGGIDYNESVRRFFRRNAISMLATDISRDFHNAGRRQRDNIRRALAQLPAEHRRYDRSQVVLEPSFFSPLLGLQGRMDLLQLDHSLLIEQKSGKAAWPEPTAGGRLTQQPAHYVQMLLYMAVLRYNFPLTYAANGSIASFLLYSKYPDGLCRLGSSPRLLHQAMRVRNLIVHSDLAGARDGYAVLDSLTPEAIRVTRNVNPRLWELYVRPQLASVLDPVHRASELERLYFHAMMRFVANEHILAKTAGGGDADGIYTGLRIDGFTSDSATALPLGQTEITEVRLAFGDPVEASMQNFRKGDIVILYPYQPGTTPDVARAIVNRGTIVDITSDGLTLRLRAPQSDARVFTRYDGYQWAVEHDFMESGWTAQYRGVHSFLTVPESRRRLLLMQDAPRVDRQARLRGAYGDFDDLQRRVRRARDLFLIIGPPGTGKTSYGMLHTLQEALADESASVLVTAYTNRAVDEVCGKLAAEGIDFLRIGNASACDPRYLGHMLSEQVDGCGSLEALRRLVLGARVVVATTTALCANLAIFLLKAFDLAIIDEASQILEPQLLPILCARHGDGCAVRKVVMIGDHKQLPAVVQQPPAMSAVADPRLHAVGLTDCRLSLFERLLRRYGDDPDVTYMLTRQGRMHPAIADFPNRAFYCGRLDAVPLPHQSEDGCDAGDAGGFVGRCRLAFLPVRPGDDDLPSDKVNLAEARVIASLVHGAWRWAVESGDGFDPDSTVGVIVPYRNQIAAVRRAIAGYGVAGLDGISIDTVERYQGSQRECVIYGTTVSSPAQLEFLTANTFEDAGEQIDRKLNVALTRARRRMYVVGNPDILALDPVYRRLIDSLPHSDPDF